MGRHDVERRISPAVCRRPSQSAQRGGRREKGGRGERVSKNASTQARQRQVTGKTATAASIIRARRTRKGNIGAHILGTLCLLRPESPNDNAGLPRSDRALELPNCLGILLPVFPHPCRGLGGLFFLGHDSFPTHSKRSFVLWEGEGALPSQPLKKHKSPRTVEGAVPILIDSAVTRKVLQTGSLLTPRLLPLSS